MADHTITDIKVKLLSPEEEAAERLAGTYDPNSLTIEAKVKLAVPIDFITITAVIEPRADHAERLKTCAEFEPGEPAPGNTCQTDGHYLCQECTHIAPEKTTAAVEAAAAEEARLREEERLAKEAGLRLSGEYPQRCGHCRTGVIVAARCTTCGDLQRIGPP